MIVLYEICIWLAFFHRRKQREAELAEQEELRKKLLAAPPLTASYGEDEHFDHDHDGDEIDMDEQMEIYHRDHEGMFDHDEGEGDEEDTGTYDFDDDELEDDHPPADYTNTYRPEDDDTPDHDDGNDDDNSQNKDRPS